MTEKKNVTKKPVARKTPTKKVEAVEEVQPKAPARPKRIEIDRSEMIPCRSVTIGTLIHISDRTHARFVWKEFGTVQYMEMGELLDMRASHPKFLNDVYLIVEDEEAVEALNLTKKYENLGQFDLIDDLFDMDQSELAEMLPKLPKGLQSSVGNRARKLVEEGTLDKLGIIRTVEDALNIDLKMFVD